MLYMFVATWDPAKSPEVMKRFPTWAGWAPKGMKEIGMWGDVWGHRCFRLCEIPDADPKVMFASHLPWDDLLEIEAYQVIDTKNSMGVIGEAMKLVPKK